MTADPDVALSENSETEWRPSLVDRLLKMDRWPGNYYIRDGMPDADEAEILRVARERWNRERNSRLIDFFGYLSYGIGFGGGALFGVLGLLWHPFWKVALSLVVGWFLLAAVVWIALVLGLLGHGTLSLFGLEIKRKRD